MNEKRTGTPTELKTMLRVSRMAMESLQRLIAGTQDYWYGDIPKAYRGLEATFSVTLESLDDYAQLVSERLLTLEDAREKETPKYPRRGRSRKRHENRNANRAESGITPDHLNAQPPDQTPTVDRELLAGGSPGGV